MPRYYPKVINCLICGARRETFSHAKYCEKHAHSVKLAQMRKYQKGRKKRYYYPKPPKIISCRECGASIVKTGNNRFCSEGCIYANNVKVFGEAKAKHMATARKMAKEKQAESALPTKIEITPQQIQQISPEKIERYWDRIV